jgi:pentose-5-phosphate-3-epimerase
VLVAGSAVFGKRDPKQYAANINAIRIAAEAAVI